MRFSFDLPLDALQRQIARRVLAEEGAPFDPAEPERFRGQVRRLWERYQAALAAAPGLQNRLDRAIYQRRREEHIDDPSLPDERRLRLIEGLDRLNRSFGTYAWFIRAIGELLRELPPGELSLLDIGSGHGAFPIRIEAAARRGRFGAHRLQITGSDIEPAYVERARRAAKEAGAAVEFRVLDALQLDRLEERFDIILCTQTVHHFPPDFVAELLARARANARQRLLFFDGRRSPLALAAISLLGLPISGDPMLVHDGLVSVRRMYSPAELELLSRASPQGERLSAKNFGTGYVLAVGR